MRACVVGKRPKIDLNEIRAMGAREDTSKDGE